MYTIHIENKGEPQKTFDAALASLGEHEAEEYQSKSGKTYWRVPKAGGYAPRSSGAKTFQADPKKLKQEMTLEVAKNLSIQRQVAMKGAVDLIVADKRKYNQLHDTYADLMQLLNPDQAPDPFDGVEVPMTDMGDFAAEQPPIEAYDQLTLTEPF
jgi:hypothetical protein